MKMPKPTDDDRARFRSLVPDDARVEVKPMFGNLGGFVNGNMFMGLFGSDVGVKLSDADQEMVLSAGGGPFGPEERPMGATSRCRWRWALTRRSAGWRHLSPMSERCQQRRRSPSAPRPRTRPFPRLRVREDILSIRDKR
jgi:TfoX/Sxy family transcriptional regulator of competence genes